jgi:polyferredoxin
MGATFVYYVSILATLAVATVLVFGLSTLLKGNDANLSQRLMRWRIGLQFIAILVIMLFVYLTRGFG